MNKFIKVSILSAAVGLALSGCTRVGTGEVGVRVGFDKQVKHEVLQPGSFNQTLVGDVHLFPVKAIQVDIDHLTPLAKDNSTMKEVEVQVIYSVNPAAVPDIFATKSAAFHAQNRDGETLLMYTYIANATRNASYKAARNYEALLMNDNRDAIQTEIEEFLHKTLAAEHLDNEITIQQVLVKQILPADSVVQSANNLVRAKNELLQKQVEVQTAASEAQRLKELAGNPQSIEYMHAKALQDIAEGVRNGKVQTVVVPYDFKGIVNVK